MCKTLQDIVLKQKDSINLKECYIETGIENILTTLDEELIGLENVKSKVR